MKRDIRMDNLRALVMFLVVLGHFLEPATTSWRLSRLYTYLYLFHMPLFAWCSGRFAKFGVRRILSRFIWPYLIFQTLWWLFMNYVCKLPLGLTYDTPYRFLWYLMAMAVWVCTVPLLDQIRKLGPTACLSFLAAAVLAGLAVGYVSRIGYRWSLSRIVVFYPFFAAGCLGRNLRLPKNRVLMVGSLAAAGAIGISLLTIWVPLDAWFYGAAPYVALGYSAGIRLLGYVCAGILSLALLCVTPQKTCFLTRMGQHTMPVYLTHVFFMYLLSMTGIFERFQSTRTRLLIVLLASAAMMLAFANEPADLLLRPLTRAPALGAREQHTKREAQAAIKAFVGSESAANRNIEK